MTEKEKQLVLDMWNSGSSIFQIASMLPYKQYSTMAEITEMAKSGFLPERNKHEIMVEKLREAFLYGASVEQMAMMFCLKEITVAKYLREAGYSVYVVKGASKQTKEIVQELIEGIGISALAKKYGVSRQRIYAIKQKYL